MTPTVRTALKSFTGWPNLHSSDKVLRHRSDSENRLERTIDLDAAELAFPHQGMEPAWQESATAS